MGPAPTAPVVSRTSASPTMTLTPLPGARYSPFGARWSPFGEAGMRWRRPCPAACFPRAATAASATAGDPGCPGRRPPRPRPAQALHGLLPGREKTGGSARRTEQLSGASGEITTGGCVGPRGAFPGPARRSSLSYGDCRRARGCPAPGRQAPRSRRRRQTPTGRAVRWGRPLGRCSLQPAVSPVAPVGSGWRNRAQPFTPLSRRGKTR